MQGLLPSQECSSSATRVFSRIPTMSEKHVFSLAFLTNWDFFCRALRDVVGGCVPRLSPVCPQISSLFWVSVTAERSYPTTGQGKGGSRPTTELIQLTNQPKPEVVVTVISVDPIAVSGTSVTRVVAPRPTPQNTGRAPMIMVPH
jgi:hypothetical protein